MLTSEGVGVVVEDDRWGAAPEDTLRAWVLVGRTVDSNVRGHRYRMNGGKDTQRVLCVAAVVVDSP